MNFFISRIALLVVAPLIAALCAGIADADCFAPPIGLVGWWRGEVNGTDFVATNNGTPVNATYTNGVVGQSFSFFPNSYAYGTYTGVQIADRPEYALTNSLTIEGWIRPRSDSYVIFTRGDGRPGLDPYSISMNGNHEFWFSICNAGGNGTNIITMIPYNQWIHVAATLNGTNGQMQIYTNGVLAVQKFTSIRPFGTLDVSQSPGVGIGNVNDGFNNFPFDGDVDEISLYNRALTTNEIIAIYNAGSAGKCASVVVASNPPAVPVIANFTPVSGTNGSLVTVLGTNFSATASSNTVYFGAVKATVLGAGTNVLTVMVPVGATLAPITVTVGGLTAASEKFFVPTFHGNGSNITAASFGSSFTMNMGNSPSSCIISDFDGDGRPDLAVANTDSYTISLIRNIGTNSDLSAASFAGRVDLLVPPGLDNKKPYRVRSVDLDGDGKLDLIVSKVDGDNLFIFRNTAQGGGFTTNSFAPPVMINTGKGS